MLSQTNPLATPPDGYEIVLPDGRVTTIEALIGEARRARAEALAIALCGLVRRSRENLFALLAPAFGMTRRNVRHP